MLSQGIISNLAKNMFPEITLKLEQAYSDLIPVIEGGAYEPN